MTDAPILELHGIEKRFGGVQALRGVDFTLQRGELHALLGENGAGKSTLMHVAFGLHRADRGATFVDGTERRIRSPRDARALGIGMVHQHFTSVAALTVAENVALAAGWVVRPREIRRRAAEVAERAGLPLDPSAMVESLPVALKQRLEIVKALAADARILLLDEPTAVLAPPEALELLGVIRVFTARGGSAVLITHKLDEALRAADRVTVMRAGLVRWTGPVHGQTAASLARHMIGADLPRPVRVPPARGGISVRAEALDVPRPAGAGAGLGVREASLSVAAGEIVGVAAVEGNGQRELLRAVARLIPPLRGTLHVAEPLAFIAEDRTTEGLIPELSLTQNLVLAVGDPAPWRHGAWIDWRRARTEAAEDIRRYRITAPGPELPAASLSGGNQQKLAVAGALRRNPKVIVAENPTRGLDIQATAFVHDRLREAAANGAAVLVYSSDLDEVLELAQRVVVMCRGVLTEAPANSGRAQIGQMMLGLRIGD